MRAQPAPVLELQSVDLDYKTKTDTIPALRDLDFAVDQNAFVSVIGPSGCGKSTLLKVASKVLPVSRGTLRIQGKPVEQANLTGKLSYVFQKPLLLPWRTALKNVLFPLEILHGQLSSEHEKRAREMLALTGLEDFVDTPPHQLSGGMQQRISLARALVVEPELFLMDEPFSALDEITREAMQEELLRIWQNHRTSILFITHNIEEAVLLSDRIIVLSKRPGTVIRDRHIDLPRPRDEAIRSDPRFLETVQELRELLRGSVRV